MTEKVLEKNVDPIFEKKSERKAFKPSLADIVKNVMEKSKNGDFKDDKQPVNHSSNAVNYVEKSDRDAVIAKLSQFQNTSQKVAFLVSADPRENSDFLKEQYKQWARDNSRTRYVMASLGSKVCFWLGSTFLGTPESKGKPDFIYYLPWDRKVCFPGHYKEYKDSPITQNERENFIVTTNKWIILRGNKLANRAATLLLCYTLAIAGSTWIIHKIDNGYEYFKNKVKTEQMQSQTREQQIEGLKQDAMDLVAKYKAGQITEEQFNTQRQLLKDRETQIKQN